MGIFATRGLRTTAGASGDREQSSAEPRLGLPRRFDVVGESLSSDADPLPACAAVGHELARDGLSVTEALAGLRSTWQLVKGCDPTYEALAEFMTAWSETTLGYVNQLSCEDPLTGLATQAHLRGRFAELYRVNACPNQAHALVVVELSDLEDDEDAHSGDHFTRAMRISRMGEAARVVFNQVETIGRLGSARVGIIATRDDRLGRRVRVLRTLLVGTDPLRREARVWIEGLPSSDASLAILIDELARQ